MVMMTPTMMMMMITSGQSNLTKRQHRRSTRTVQSYSPGGANVHAIWYTLIGIRTVPMLPL